MVFGRFRRKTLIQQHIENVTKHLNQVGAEPEFASAGIFTGLKAVFMVTGDKKQYENHFKNMRKIEGKSNDFLLELAKCKKMHPEQGKTIDHIIGGLKAYKNGVTEYLEKRKDEALVFDEQNKVLSILLKTGEIKKIMKKLGKPVPFKFKKNSIPKPRQARREINQHILKIMQIRGSVEREREMRLDKKYYDAEKEDGAKILQMINKIHSSRASDIEQTDMPAKLIHALHLQYWDLENKMELEENDRNRRRRF